MDLSVRTYLFISFSCHPCLSPMICNGFKNKLNQHNRMWNVLNKSMSSNFALKLFKKEYLFYLSYLENNIKCYFNNLL